MPAPAPVPAGPSLPGDGSPISERAARPFLAGPAAAGIAAASGASPLTLGPIDDVSASGPTVPASGPTIPVLGPSVPVAGPTRSAPAPIMPVAGPTGSAPEHAGFVSPSGLSPQSERREDLGNPEARAGCTPAQLRRFIKSRAYVPLHELRRRFELNGEEDDVSPIELDGRRLFVGLPDREARILGELMQAGDVGCELLLDPTSPLVVGVFPMRPVPRA